MDLRIKKSIQVITKVIDDLGFENAKQFSDALGFDRPERIYKILRGKTAVSRNLAEIINEKYPQYKTDWLLTGDAEMKKRSEKTLLQANDEQVKYKLEERITLLDVRDDLKADLAVIAEGMTVNFEKVAGALFESLKGQQKILRFINKLDPEKINNATGKLDEFLEVNKK